MAKLNNSMDSFIITGFDHLQNHKLLGFLVLLTYMLVLLANSINLCIILTARHLHRPMYILICNLAVVDIMYSSACGITMISVLLAEIKTLSYLGCISRMFFYHLGDIKVCLALTLMAIDRLVAIRFPLRYHSMVTPARAILVILLTWLISIAIMCLLVSVADSLPYCHPQPVIIYVFCDFASMIRAACVIPEPYFLLPTLISLWLVGGQFPFILCTYAVLAYSVSKLSNNANKSQLINTVLSHLIVLFSYFVPKLVVILLTRVGVVLNLTDRNAILIYSSLIPPLINPTVYSMRTKEIRQRIAYVFLGKKVAPDH